MKRLSALILALFLSLTLFVGCGSNETSIDRVEPGTVPSVETVEPGKSSGSDSSSEPDGETPPSDAVPPDPTPSDGDEDHSTSEGATLPANGESSQSTANSEPVIPNASTSFDYGSVPEYSGTPYVTVNGNEPYFNTSALTPVSVESYSPLDNLGRCGVAYACIGKDIMPTEERGSIGQVKPSGWHTVRYDDLVDGKYLYNRCHLVGYQLAGENANTSNLITGTRYLNVEGMLPFENLTADYVQESGNHVAYRVTPIFVGDDLLARGVLMEGYSVEDAGRGICFCVFVYNVQPGISIDYATGDSKLAEGTGGATSAPAETQTPTATENPEPSSTDTTTPTQGNTYILNTNTKKFHLPGCSSVKDMKEANKKEFTGSRDEVISQGYSPCKRCNP